MHFIVKLFPEIIVKSPPVRRRQTALLRDNLVRQFEALSIPAIVHKDWEKIEVLIDTEDPDLTHSCARILGQTPGIAKFSRAQVIEFEHLEEIPQRLPVSLLTGLAGRRFAVRAKRSGQQQFTSVDVERLVGAWVLEHAPDARVDLTRPERRLELEIRDNRVFALEQTWQGMGGFPLGSQGAVLSLLSGGYDSGVASYQMLRRGLVTHFVFFNLGGAAHELAVRETAHQLWSQYARSHSLQFISVPFRHVVEEIRLKVPGSYANILLKRLMLRAASLIAKRLQLPALVTGDSIAQVSSQTLTNLSITEMAADRPVLRPLIAMDKGAIIDLARIIGTADLAASLPEYCGLGSARPTTEAKLERVLACEANLPEGLIESTVRDAERLSVEKLLEAQETPQITSYSRVPALARVIDIRHPEESQRAPLNLACEVENIPFFQIQRRFAETPEILNLLYCDRGLLSRLHAELLLEAGISNVGVYRPN